MDGDKPSLHEIAAMPFPASVLAMQKHYDPTWGKEPPPPSGKRKFFVKADWTISGRFRDEVEAENREEAEEIIKEWVMDDAYSGDVDLDIRSFEEVEDDA